MDELVVVNEDNIDTINERLGKLYELFSLDPSYEDITIGNSNITIAYPDEPNYIDYSIGDLLTYTEDISSITKVDNATVRSSRVVQTIINGASSYSPHLEFLGDELIEDEKYTVSIQSEPFLIGLIATKERIFDEDYGISPCTIYTALEIVYKDAESVLDRKSEIKLIKEILFYLSHKYSTPLEIGEFFEFERSSPFDDFADDYEDDESEDVKVVKTPSKNLLGYTNLMDMYIEALSVGNKEICFLYYYKIIEHCSPIVSKMKAYEQLNRKLDLMPFNDRDYKYLDSIFELTREYDISLRDSELAYTVLLECIDIVQLYDFLPENLKKRLSKKYQYQNEAINYKFDVVKLNQIKHGISSILYATRNSIVHAKSNYIPTGDECNNEDLDSLNIFISKLCYCLIAWNNRQPEMFRLK